MARQNKDKKVDRFTVNVVESGTHKTLHSYKFTRLTAALFFTNAFIMLCLIIFVLVAYTPLKTFIPGYPDAMSKRDAVNNAIKVDSLERVIYKWELYSENIRRVLQGDETIDIQSIITVPDTVSTFRDDGPGYTDAQFREAVMKEEQFDLPAGMKRNLPLEGIHFFQPVKGVVSKGFDELTHPYLDITAPANSLVMAPLDGTVIFTGWNNDAGYTLQIQHENDLVTIFQHTEKLLKKTGDKVRAGTPVALVGSAESLSLGDHLRLELWYKGEAVDPQKYMTL